MAKLSPLWRKSVLYQNINVEKPIPTLCSHYSSTHRHRKDFTHHRLLYSLCSHWTSYLVVPYSALSPKSIKKKKSQLEYVCFTITAVSDAVDCWLIIQGWQMETERSVVRKRGIYSAKVNGVSAMAASDSLPDSGHSAVTLETAQEPQKGTTCRLSRR